ncbi:MAG: hypothetical protein H6559_26355 [Lewinellaceae bacterium]|nr:hypothetical protein [Lewinellaceae bacterium]
MLRYTGESCSASNTTQDASKWDCSGNPNGDPSVYIIANDDSDPTNGKIWFTGNVSLNGVFLADAANAGETKLSSNTYIHIYNQQGGSVIQTIRIHTSCSAPLVTGEQWGSLVLLEVVDEDGAQCGGASTNVTYQWQYRNGTSGAWIDIPGATGASYNPGTIPRPASTAAWYRQRRRRQLPYHCFQYRHQNGHLQLVRFYFRQHRPLRRPIDYPDRSCFRRHASAVLFLEHRFVGYQH